MNKSASIKKVAAVHVAKMERKAFLAGSLGDSLAKAVLEKESSVVRSSLSKDAESGLFLLAKRNAESFSDFISPEKQDKDDAAQRMFRYAFAQASSREEVREMAGKCAKAYSKQDISGMASALRLPKDVVLVVLLSYLKGNRRNASYKSRSRSLERGFDSLLDISSSSLSLISRFVKGGVGFLRYLLPERLGDAISAPLTFGVLAGLLMSSWPIIIGASSLLAGIFTSALSALSSYSFVSASLIVLGLSGSLIYAAIEACIWLGTEVKELKEWSKGNLADALRLSFKFIWEASKMILKGLYRVSKWFMSEIKEYFSLLQKDYDSSDDASSPPALEYDLGELSAYV